VEVKKMKGKIPQEIEKVVREWLDATDQHLATHGGANYCYLTDNSFDYSRVSSHPVDLQWAWEDNSISVTADGNIDICGNDIPLKWDIAKIRRRCEDALRKTGKQDIILQTAVLLGVKLT
jgi:hypothetical protein